MSSKIENEKIKQLSIRGRVAFCAMCLEKAISKLGLDSPQMDKIISLLWEFTESNNFAEWEKKATEVSPDTVLENHLDNDFADYETLSVEYLNNLKDSYLSMPKEIIELISWSLETGLSNLYGNTGEYSETTFNAVEKVISIMNKLQVGLPDINLIKFSHFQEEFGWGDRFSKVSLLKNK